MVGGLASDQVDQLSDCYCWREQKQRDITLRVERPQYGCPAPGGGAPSALNRIPAGPLCTSADCFINNRSPP